LDFGRKCRIQNVGYYYNYFNNYMHEYNYYLNDGKDLLIIKGDN